MVDILANNTVLLVSDLRVCTVVRPFMLIYDTVNSWYKLAFVCFQNVNIGILLPLMFLSTIAGHGSLIDFMQLHSR